MKICRGIYESEQVRNDRDFIDDYCRQNNCEEKDISEEQMEKIDDDKWNYYDGDFRADCDSIRIATDDGVCTYEFVKRGDEIIMGSDESDDIIEKILLHYFSDNWNDKSISPEFDRGDLNARLQNGTDADVWIKYRGGQGYCYAFCGYNSKDFIS